MSDDIPRTIFQFWHDTSSLPAQYSDAIRHNVSLNPGYKHILANDSFVSSLLRKHFSPALSALYQHNRIPASRSDIARLALLHHYGGIYFDASIHLHRPVCCITTGTVQTLLLRRDDMAHYANHPEKANFWNGLIACSPNSPFLELCLRKIVSTLLSGIHNHNVLKATGPGIINGVAENTDSKCITACSFKRLKDEGVLEHIRLPGLRNSWKPLQAHGIIEPRALEELRLTLS